MNTKSKNAHHLLMRKIILIFFFSFAIICLKAQTGKDGALTVTTTNTVLNRYSRVTTDVLAGANTITVANINDLNRDGITYLAGFNTPANAYANNTLSSGDLVLLYQAQGASINTTNTMSYGEVTSLNGAGTYEFAYVASVSGNTITLGCRARNSYFAARYAQVIRVPQYTTLTVNSGASVRALPWGSPNFGGADPSAIERRRGGFISIHATNVVNNGSINANEAGFRGGTRENNTTTNGATYSTNFVTTDAGLSAEKGESIAGYRTDYDALNGRYGRGAPANAGGGGNSHNAGGGGGANGGVPANWFRGAGVMNDFGGTCGNPGAWALDPNYIANGNALTNSSGGGHGGYTFANSNQNACVLGPSYPAGFISAGVPAANIQNTAWGGDRRDAVGGLGGRPLVSPNFQNQIFFGGGGGAGDGNNNANADGGDGGGIVFLIITNTLSGTGTVQANGENGFNTVPGHNDAPGGGGGGGTVVIKATTINNTLTFNANGGNGGNQLITNNESEGPGGGGGGGVLAIQAGTDASTKTVNGGANGRTSSNAMTEFLANGATSGNVGTIITASVNLSYVYCPPNPQAFDDINTTLEGVAVSGTVLTNDISDFPLAATPVTLISPTPDPATEGTLTFNADGTYTFVPVAGFTGTINLTYQVCNNIGLCDQANLSIIVYPVSDANEPPIAQNDVVQTFSGETLTNNALLNDYDPDFGQSLTVTAVTTPTAITGGTYTIDEQGNYTFIPNAGFSGETSFTYEVCDDGTPPLCSTSTVFITVLPSRVSTSANYPPFAQDDAASTFVNTQIAGNVLANDEDPDGNILTVNAVGPTLIPGVGTYQIFADGSYTFTPVTGYTGPANFSYTVCDNGTPSFCDQATVYITIRPEAPIANDDINNTFASQTTTGNVLTNDFDPHGGTLVVTSGTVTSAAGVSVTVNTDGTYSYTPNGAANAAGTDSFTYTVCNNPTPGLCSQATVVINVTTIPPSPGSNIPPVAHNDIAETIKNVTVSSNVLLNDFDPDPNNVLTVTQINGSTSDIGSPIAINGGTVTLNTDGTYSFVPNTDFVGITSFDYQVCDSGVPQECEIATVSISIYPPSSLPNNPPFAQDDASNGLVNTVLTGNVLGNDADPDGNNLSVTPIAPTLIPGVGTYSIDASGVYTFEPVLNYSGPVSFTYTVCDDGSPSRCDEATVYLRIRPVAPIAENDINTTLAGLATSGNVLTNDTDPLAGTLTITTTTVTTASGVTVNINPTTGVYTYTPNAAAELAGEDSFTYTVCNASTCSQATVYINIFQNQIGNSAPIAHNDLAQTIAGIDLSGNVLGNDADPDGDNLAVTPQTITNANGTFTLLADGSFTFEPATGITGVFEYPYEVCDDATPTPACATAVLTVVVYPEDVTPPANYPPYAQDDAAIGILNNVINGTVLSNDFDPNNPDALTVTAVATPTNVFAADGTTIAGTYTIDANGNYTFTPAAGFAGTTSFTYTVSNVGGSDIATVYLTVRPDGVLIANDDINNTSQGVTVGGNLGTNDTSIGTPNFTGSTTLAGVGTFTITNPATGAYTFVPEAGFTGTATFPYTLCSDVPGITCVNGTVSINVFPVLNDNNPPVVHDDILETTAGFTASGNVLSNDFDPDFGQTLTVTALNGNTASIGVATPITGGTLTLNANGTYTFVPTPGFEGTTSFEYTVCDDATPQACETATVNITVYPVPTTPPTDYSPYAQDDAGAGDLNTIQEGNVLGNDTDPEGNTLVVTAVATPANVFAADGITVAGTYTIDAGGNYVFTPADGFIGTTSFTYQVCADSPNCDFATVYLTVLPESPRAKDDINNTPLDTPVAGNLLTNDTNLGGGTPAITAINGNPIVANTPIAVTGGTLIITDLATGEYTFIPDEGFTGEATFTYTVCNNLIPNLCSDASVSINVYQVSQDPTTSNNPPVVHDDVVETTEGNTVSGSVLSNDFDPDGGQTLTVTQLNGVDFTTTTTVAIVGGSLTLNDDGTYNFVPDAGFTGTTSFEYTVCDDGTPQACEIATVTITVYPNDRANNPPFAQDDAILVEVNTAYNANTPALGLLANDDEVDGDNLTVTQINGAGFTVGSPITLPSGATLTITDATTGTYTYTPNPDYYGPDQFTYQICDDGTPSRCDVATVYIVVQPRNPDPQPDINNTLMNTPVAGNVLTNDQDPQGLALTVTAGTFPTANGSITFNADGTYTFTPNFGFQGTEVITYEVCNSLGVCETATLTITVQQQLPQLPTPQNNTPVANNDVGQTLAGITLNGNVVTNDFDRDLGQTLTVNTTPVSNVSNGTLTLNADGTYSYVPNAGFTGTDSFTYEVCDNATPTPACATATVFITVYPNNNPDALAQINHPPFAQDDAGFVYQSTAATPTSLAGNVLGNDFDPDGGTLTVVAVGTPTDVLAADGITVIGTYTINATGDYVFTPSVGYTGPASFTYQVCNDAPTNSRCDVATVYITIQAASPLPPISRNDLANTLIDTPVTGTILVNDQDLFGLRFVRNPNTPPTIPPSNGVVVFNADGTYTYTPNAGYEGPDSFTYEICNSAGLCSQSTVFINVVDAVAGSNNSPVVQNDFAETLQGIDVTGNVLSNDFDYDGNTLTVTQINGVPFTSGSPITLANGTLTINSDGTYTFEPNPAFAGIQTFTYQTCDDGSPIECATATVAITVYPTGAPSLPFAQNDAYVTYLSVPLSSNVLINDSNLGTITSLTIITAPSNGVITSGINPDGTFTYTPNLNHFGPDYFVYEVCNANGCAIATASILTIDASGPLPLDLLSFEAFKQGEAVELIWKTINESEVSHFEIERSANGLDFEYLARVDARNLGATLSTYTWRDEQPLYGDNYYRLKQIEQDGSFVYSGIAYANFEAEVSMQLYPNPSPEQVTLKVNRAAQLLQVEVMDVSGRRLNQLEGTTNDEGELNVSLQGLGAGTYYLKVQLGTQNFTKVIVKY